MPAMEEDSEDSEEENIKLGSSVSDCNRLAESVAKLSESKVGVVVYRWEEDLHRWRRSKTGGVATIRPSARRVVDRGKEADHDLGVRFIFVCVCVWLPFSSLFFSLKTHQHAAGSNVVPSYIGGCLNFFFFFCVFERFKEKL